MSFINDFNKAIENYIDDSCSIAMVNFSMIGNSGNVLNEGERFRFKVRISNNSYLDMKNIKIVILGTDHARVSNFPNSLFQRATGQSISRIDARQSYTIPNYVYGKARRLTNGQRTIVTAKITAWDASLNHLLIDRSSSSDLEGKLQSEIYDS